MFEEVDHFLVASGGDLKFSVFEVFCSLVLEYLGLLQLGVRVQLPGLLRLLETHQLDLGSTE